MIKRILIISGTLITIGLLVYISMVIYWFNTAEIKVEKQYNAITIGNRDVATYNVFVNPVGKYEVLKQIDESIRLQIAEYMSKHQLKLTEGTHEFNRTNGTFDELVNENFRFEELNIIFDRDMALKTGEILLEKYFSDVFLNSEMDLNITEISDGWKVYVTVKKDIKTTSGELFVANGGEVYVEFRKSNGEILEMGVNNLID